MTDPSKIAILEQILESAENSIISAKQLVAELNGKNKKSSKYIKSKAYNLQTDPKGKIVEGIFDGENMIDKKGAIYPVQPNYASKSKLIPGDTLKLTILDDGSFIFKQIKLTDRKKVVGNIIEDGENYKVLANGKPYTVNKASVTYFKGKPGDEVTLIIPKKEDSEWGAVENIIVKPNKDKS